MLFGQPKEPDIASAPAGGYIFDATDADFEQRVLIPSMEKPVIVDFWAEWCGPCKQLGPMLEKAVNDTGGAVLMAKVDVDKNQGIAQALKIQSIPTVYAFFQGRPIDGFQGAVPESRLKTFIDQLVRISKEAAPDAIDVPAVLKEAAQRLVSGDWEQAKELYAAILIQDPANAQAYAGIIRAAIAGGDVEMAQGLMDEAPDSIKKSGPLNEVKTALELAQAKPAGSTKEFEEKLEKNADDHRARYDLAIAQFTAGEKEQGMDSLLEIIRRNRGWNENAARTQLLKFFEALGPADPLTLQGRRKLSSILFS